MLISKNLPMVVVASFDRLFSYGTMQCSVRFEGKAQTEPWAVTRWVLTIPDHPRNGLVKYVLEKESGLWARVLRINGLNLFEENALMDWALREIE